MKKKLILNMVLLPFIFSGCVVLDDLIEGRGLDGTMDPNAYQTEHGILLADVAVNSIGNLTNNESFLLLPANQNVRATDLQFKEFSAYVSRALVHKGLKVAKTIDEADILFFVGYGVGTPNKHSQMYSVPTFGQTGVSSSHTTGYIDSYGTYSGTTISIPSYGVTGSSTHQRTWTTYTKHILLEAIDANEFRRSKEIVQRWKLVSASDDELSDLRLLFPTILAGSMPYIGIDSQYTKVESVVSKNKYIPIITDRTTTK